MTRSLRVARVAAVLLVGVSATAQAQSLGRRVEGAAGNTVQFSFASRPGVCGDGKTYIRTDTDSWYGSFNDYTRSLPCEAGPVRVVVVKAGNEIIKLEPYAGPVATPADVTDLGRVSSADAVAYLGTLARGGEGRVAREALLPLALADSASVSPILLEIARDQAKPRELRRSALSWLSRRRGAADAIPAAQLVTIVRGFVTDPNEHQAFRQSGVGVLSRFDRGEGIPALVEISSQTSDPWLAKQATEALARSGDPRGRRAVRALAEREDAPMEVRAAAINGIGSEFGTTQDAAALVRAYPNLNNDRLKDAAMSAMASVGGTEVRTFLMSVVRDENAVARQRRKAASLLDRAGVPVRDVIRTYDQVSDGEVRGTLIDLMAQAGTKEAMTKLMAIAREDTQLSARRRAINALGRTDDPAVREALKGLISER
jgi:HEAT repeat protein